MSLKLDQLTEEMIRFAEKELGVEEEMLRSVEENEEKRQEILEKLLWIEVEEVDNSQEDQYSKRGEIASNLLTLLCYPAPEGTDDRE